MEGELFAGRKIQAIKLLREATGLGLKESKDLADAMEKELRGTSPEKFRVPSGKSGCAGMLLMVGGAGMGLLVSWLVWM